MTSSSRKLKKLGVGLPPSFTPTSGNAAAGGACGGVSRWGVLSREPEEVEGEEEEAPDEGSEKSSVLKISLKSWAVYSVPYCGVANMDCAMGESTSMVGLVVVVSKRVCCL